MKRGKKLLSLLLVLAVLLGATYLVGLLEPEAAEEVSYETIFTLDAESVTALSWDYSEAVAFEKQDDEWIYTEDDAFTVESGYLEEMLSALAEVTSYKTIENVEDWDQYNLEIPVCAITVTAGETYTLAIGDETGTGGERYFSIGDGNVYLVDADIIEPFSYGLYDVLAYESIPAMTEVTGLTVTTEKNSYIITLLEDSGLAYSDEYVWFLDGKALDNELTETLIDSVTGLTWQDCANFHVADLADYGLAEPELTVAVDYEGGTFTIEIGSETGDYRYARIKGSSMVYKIKETVADTLMNTTYYDLRPDEVLLMDWEEVTAIDVTLDGETYTFTKGTKTVTDDDGNESEETVYFLNGEETDLEDVTGVLDNMSSTGYATGLTAEQEEIRLLIHRDQDAFPEVELAFFRYDSSSCMTVLNGEATVFVSRESVVSLVEEINSLILN